MLTCSLMEWIFTSRIQRLDENIIKLSTEDTLCVTNGYLAFTFFNFCWILNKTLKTSVDQWILVLKKVIYIYNLYLIIYLRIYLHVYIYLSIHSPIHPSIHSSIYPSIHLFIIIVLCFGFFKSMSRVLNSSNNHTVLYI